jgi:nitroreductase
MSSSAEIGLFEAMSTARAIRRFKPEPIEGGVIASLVEAASFAPSGGNLQQWRVVIVTGATQKVALGPIWRSSWSRYLSGLDLGDHEATADLKDRQLAAASAMADAIEQVPAIAIFCHYPELIGFTDADLDRPSVVGGASLYPAVQNFLLACRAHGLGAVLTTTLCIAESEVAELLGLPDNVGVHAAVPFGYPDGVAHGPLKRRPIERLAYTDRWGEPM